MNRPVLFAGTVLLGLGTFAMQTGRHRPSVMPPSVVEHANDAAYRDGLYLGTLAAHRGDPYHASAGRWANANDRSAFADGYRQGYSSTRGETR
jgi:hypothetical protein